eukprot:TRINITY_DN11197_c0_g2_i2.p2 TRINITY_DN11197_c0_g2~~TRINITY_DN11197_c0_g2_i2.p2  ORF type:complete len:139 (+),score=24.72 TRINITY_DN11197_c0_g2_i2:391-807(+)
MKKRNQWAYNLKLNPLNKNDVEFMREKNETKIVNYIVFYGLQTKNKNNQFPLSDANFKEYKKKTKKSSQQFDDSAISQYKSDLNCNYNDFLSSLVSNQSDTQSKSQEKSLTSISAQQKKRKKKTDLKLKINQKQLHKL